MYWVKQPLTYLNLKVNYSMKSEKINELFKVEKPVIGMVHLLPLPGDYAYENNLDYVVERALADALTLKEGGVHGYIIENAGSQPFHIMDEIEIAEIAIISRIAEILKVKTGLPFGINIASNGVKQALAVSKATGGTFVRATGWVNGYYSSSGFVAPCAPECMDYKKKINAEKIMVFADIKVKNGSHAFIQDKDILTLSKDAFAAYADAVILTGESTGIMPNQEELKLLYNALSGPVLIGSGTDINNLKDMLPYGDAFIIGTSFKEHRKMSEPVQLEKVKAFMKEWNRLMVENDSKERS